MRAIILHRSSATYLTNREIPQLTSQNDVLVRVYYAGICRTDIGIGKGTVPAREDIVLGHEFCGKVAQAMGKRHIERIEHTNDLQRNCYDCIIETEPFNIDAYIEALRPGGMLVLKSRSYTPSCFTANTIAMKEVCIRGARYGNFNVASHILTSTAHHLANSLNTSTLFGNTYELSQFEAAFAEAERTGSKKTFFKICAE